MTSWLLGWLTDFVGCLLACLVEQMIALLTDGFLAYNWSVDGFSSLADLLLASLFSCCIMEQMTPWPKFFCFF